MYKAVDGQLRQYNLARVRHRTRDRAQKFKTYQTVEFPANAASLFRTSVSISGTTVVSEGYATVLDKDPEEEVDHPSRLQLKEALNTRVGEQWVAM